MLPYVVDKPEQVDEISRDIRGLQRYIEALDARSLIVPYELQCQAEAACACGPRHLPRPGHAGTHHACQGCRPAAGLQPACSMRGGAAAHGLGPAGGRDAALQGGTVHPRHRAPARGLGRDALHDAAVNPSTLRRSSACCHAELLLLLLRAGLCLSMDGPPTNSLLKELMRGRSHALDLAAVWPPLLSALHALLGGLQPGFRSWPNAVKMVQDVHIVRLSPSPCFCALLCQKRRLP